MNYFELKEELTSVLNNLGSAKISTREEDVQMGIERIKETVAWSIELFQEGKRALEDGKVSFGEGFGFIGNTIRFVPVAKNARIAIEELADLTKEETDELLSFIKEKFPDMEGNASKWIIWSSKALATSVNLVQEAIELQQ